jgi:hypothetical protein
MKASDQIGNSNMSKVASLHLNIITRKKSLKLEFYFQQSFSMLIICIIH